MSDDSDLLIAAAATAAAITWLGTRQGEDAGGDASRWSDRLRAVAAGVQRCWKETPAYQFVQGIREILSRRR